MELKNNRLTWDKEDAFFDAILLSFDKPIVKDFCIPELYNVNDLVKNATFELSLSKRLTDRLVCITFCRGKELSELEYYINNQSLWGARFVSDWFYGYGDLYKWQDGEKAKAKKRVARYVSERDLKGLKKLQEYIQKKMSVDIGEFEIDKVIGNK